jgi:hypothetical protein
MIRVKSAPGLRVRHPVTKVLLPDDGLEIDELETFWVRRLLDRDVVMVEPEKTADAPAAPEKVTP